MNTFVDILVTAFPFVAGGWAAWALPRWAGERAPRPPSQPRQDWSAGGLPSRPYRDLQKVA